MKQRLLNLLIALDQLAWVVVTLGKGHPDETISAAAWRMEQQGKWAGKVLRPLIDILALVLTLGWDKNHCRTAYESEQRRKQLPAIYRNSP